jgi:DNA topoisomerase VI subunit A
MKSLTTVNKRGVYYSLLGQGIKSTDELDDYITDICYMLEAPRSALGIVASCKGLLAGGGLTSLETIEYLQMPSYMARATCFDELGMPNLSRVLVVEKETTFSQVIQMEWYIQLQSSVVAD